MQKRDLLLEIGLEELPARFVTDSMEQLKKKVTSFLNEKNVPFENVKAFSTPRRLAVIVEGVEEQQADVTEELRGPAKKIAYDQEGNWSKAVQGFARGQGVSLDNLYFQEVKGNEYVFAKKHTKGQETKTLLSELAQIVTGLTFPKNMRWGHNELRYARPIKWMICLFGEEVVDFSVLDVKTGNTSAGHRTLGDQTTITSPKDYEYLLSEEHVIVDPKKRESIILKGIKELSEEKGWKVPVDADLLEEVNNLVEYPTVFFGTFKDEFLEVPQEVLITSMKEHQRYFPVLDENNTLLPFFVAVRNGDDYKIENVVRGNEKVLGARLSDAVFFFREDKKLTIESCVAKLSKIVYHEEIGTLSEKVTRTEQLVGEIGVQLQLDNAIVEAAQRASAIGKFDLVTNMVYEFPELQGIMGEKYARLLGEDEAVCRAINEQYQPRNAEDSLPASEVGSLLSLSEKLETIAGFFGIRLIPTGSQDPFALRRQASGVLSILIERNWDVSLQTLIETVVEKQASAGFYKVTKEEVAKEIMDFFKVRLKTILTEENVAYDTVEAVLGGNVHSVPSTITIAKTIEVERQKEGFKETVEQFVRVMNLASKATTTDINEALFETNHERELYTTYVDVKATVEQTNDFTQQFVEMSRLRPFIEAFFENVMVMAKDEAVKTNRLALMGALGAMFASFADFKELVVK